ncbi:MAG: HRDC domain-containing protein [Desulfuromonadales bacterium]
MQWAFYRIPVIGGAESDELNRFLRSVRVLTVHREFVDQGDASFWALAVEYLPAADSGHRSARGISSKTDFKALLPPEDFALFARLREWRKQAANTEAVPVYTIFTNEQLAEMSRRRPSSVSALGEIDGIGQGRIEKYGKVVLEVIGGFRDGAGEGTVSPDN